MKLDEFGGKEKFKTIDGENPADKPEALAAGSKSTGKNAVLDTPVPDTSQHLANYLSLDSSISRSALSDSVSAGVS